MAALKHNDNLAPESYPSMVYFIRMGSLIKIGYTTNLSARFRALRGHSADYPIVLLTFYGGRDEERRLHEAFAAYRKHGEFFEATPYVTYFSHVTKESGIDAAWAWLEANNPVVAKQRREEARRERDNHARMTEQEFDAYCARLVAERKKRLGW